MTQIDFDKPVRLNHPAYEQPLSVEILRANLPAPMLAVGLVFVPNPSGKGTTPAVVQFNETGMSQHQGSQLINYVPEEGSFTPRSLRVGIPSMTFKTKSGLKATFLSANGVDLDWEVNFLNGPPGYVTTDDKGRILEPRPAHADQLDVVEVHPTVTRFVRVYDKAKTAKNPTQLANAYEFSSLEEARSNMQGVRGIGILQYREGDFSPCLKG